MEIQNLPEKNLLRWFIDRLDNTFVFFDTETSGLKREQNNQLTQVAAIATKLNPKDLKFDEVGRFEVKIKLNDNVLKAIALEPDEPEDEKEKEKWKWGTKKGILKYNHYDLVNSPSYEEERKALERFDNFLKSHQNVILIAHNAPFDLSWIQFEEMFKDSTIKTIDSMRFFSNIFFPTLSKLSEVDPRFSTAYDKFPFREPKKDKPDDVKKKSVGLGSIVKGFSDDVNKLQDKLSGAHNAVVDCELMKDVIERGLHLIYVHISD